MNEGQIDTFLAAASNGSFSAAAILLNLTQPTVSHRIRTLEEELDTALFVRRAADVALTPAGLAFLPEAEKLKKAYSSARRAIRAYAVRQQLVIAFPALMVQGRFKAYQAVMRLKTPGIRLQARIINTPEEGPAALMSGEADLVFADPTQACFSGDEFRFRSLFRSGAYVCVHRGHRLAGKAAAVPEDLAGETVFTYRDSTFFTETALRALSPQGIDIRRGKASAEETARRLRPDGGVMLTITRSLENEWLVHVPLTLERSMQAGLIWTGSREDEKLLSIVDQIGALPLTVWRT